MNLGLTGLAAIGSTAEAVGASGKPIRVYDAILVDTGNTLSLYSGTTTAGPAVIVLSAAAGIFEMHSNVGIRFANGCFASATGGSAHVNFIREF
jgi:hypothetical protein